MSILTTSVIFRVGKNVNFIGIIKPREDRQGSQLFTFGWKYLAKIPVADLMIHCSNSLFLSVKKR
jgi:hypothetical protein